MAEKYASEEESQHLFLLIEVNHYTIRGRGSSEGEVTTPFPLNRGQTIGGPPPNDDERHNTFLIEVKR